MNTRVIDHQQAMNDMLAERYLLGELEDSDCDAYEAHLFECNVCFAQVKAGTDFVNYVRQNGADLQVSAAVPSGWRQFFAQALRPAPAFAFTACLLAGMSVYQNVATIKKLKAPQIESRYMLTEQLRAAETSLRVSRDSRIRLAIEFQPQQQLGSYETQIVGGDGKVKLTMPFTLRPSQDTIEISLYTGDFAPGSYSMRVQATDQNGARQELAQAFFRMEFQD
jgi:hypothetical protein